ncbi:MAG: FHA domain-containing protein [Anaerolineales bacterium]
MFNSRPSERQAWRLGAYILALVGLVAFFATLLTGGVTFAQGTTRALINYPEVIEESDSVSLGLYYTMIDASGQVIQDAEVSRATVTLNDEVTHDASVGKPTSDAYVVLVLDASGSMINVVGSMKEAAIQAVESAPEEAFFSVIQFNNQVTVLQDFTDDKSTVADQLQRVFVVQNSGTCLYDATFRGLELLESAPRGRRAIVLFTDGKDDDGAGRPCSQHTYNEVISAASRQDAPVPIHTIALTTQGMTASDEARLRELATTTGGFAESGGSGSLSLLFQKIITSMSHQWLAQAEVYPQEGQNTAQLEVILEDGTRVESNPITFQSSRGYEAPPSARVESIDYAGNGDVNLNLSLIRRDRIEDLEIQIIDIDNNAPQSPISKPLDDQVRLAASNFEDGTEYRVLTRGRSADGTVLFETIYQFTYSPNIAEGELQILSVELNEEQPAFQINLNSRNLDALDHYQVWLNDAEDNTVVPGTRREVEPAASIEIPLGEVGNGEYNVVITAVDAEGTVLAEASYSQAIYQVGLLSRIGRAVRASLPFIGCLMLIALVSMGVLFKVVILDRDKGKSEGVLLESTGSSGDSGQDPWSAEALERSRQKLKKSAEDRAGGSAQPQAQAPSAPPNPEMHQAGAQAPPPGVAAQPPAGQEPGKPGLPPAHLHVERSPDGEYDGRSYRINQNPFTIGRSGNTLDFVYSGVSRSHAQIEYRNGTFYLRDNDSTNGTTLNGESIEPKQDVALSSGDKLGIGKRVLARFEFG